MLNKFTSEINDFLVFNNKPCNKKALILLHGYGTSKEDLQDLVPFFLKLNNLIIFIPNAPFKCASGIGYQWFDVKIDEFGINLDISVCKNAFTILKKFIEKINKEYNIAFENMVLFGFSQGAVMALSLALFSGYKFNSIISHSGLFFNYNNNLNIFDSPIQKKQNILLIHGKQDYVIPFFYAENTVQFFMENNINYSTFFKDDLGHNIDTDTMLESLEFIKLYY